jgi:hypothetical protein
VLLQDDAVETLALLAKGNVEVAQQLKALLQAAEGPQVQVV